MACTGLEFCKLSFVETRVRAQSLVPDLEKRLDDLNLLMPKWSAEIKRLEAVLDDATLYSRDPARFAALTKAIEVARAEKEAAEERWLTLAEAVEALG